MSKKKPLTPAEQDAHDLKVAAIMNDGTIRVPEVLHPFGAPSEIVRR